MTFCNHLLYFQSTPPRRRRPAKINRILRQFVFNPRLREGGDGIRFFFGGSAEIFNPRLREGGDFSQGLIPIPIAVFNPRLREGGDVGAERCGNRKQALFSIHASAKEATYSCHCLLLSKSFSIHASAKEATCCLPATILRSCFSIHASAKEATKAYGRKGRTEKFSIHASAKEATKGILPRVSLAFIFNPRLREGGDLYDIF